MQSNVISSKTGDQGRLAPELLTKESELRRLMRSMKKVLVAYSGGVDSAYLAFIANQELGENARCIFGVSPSVSSVQQAEAREFASQHTLSLTEITTNELDDPNYAANPVNRCFYCKSELYKKLRSLASTSAIEQIIDGTNDDDRRDTRPGRIAAIEQNVASPLADLGFSKSDIRRLSSFHGLQTSDKPSSPCLSSRIAYGIPVTRSRLGQVEKAESVLRDLGFREFRVRVHNDLARIEISGVELPGILKLDMFREISSTLKRFGFRYVTLDLEGYRSGSLN